MAPLAWAAPLGRSEKGKKGHTRIPCSEPYGHFPRSLVQRLGRRILGKRKPTTLQHLFPEFSAQTPPFISLTRLLGRCRDAYYREHSCSLFAEHRAARRSWSQKVARQHFLELELKTQRELAPSTLRRLEVRAK